MADLSQLFQYAPTTAGAFLGQQISLDNTKGRLANDTLAQQLQLEAAKEAREQEMFPLRKSNLDLQNQGLGAELPGKTADSRKKKLDADLAEQTFDSNKQATLSKNATQITKDQYEQAENASKTLMTIGDQLSGMPPMLRKQHLDQVITDMKMNPNSPLVQMMRQMDPNKLPDFTKQLSKRIGDQLLTMNPGARAQMYSADVQASASRYHSDKAAESAKYVADKNAEAKVMVANTKAKVLDLEELVLAGKMAPERAAIAAKLQADKATDPEIKEMWQNQASRWERFVYNKAAAGHEGAAQLDTENGGIKSRVTPPALGPEQPAGAPKANQTSSGTKYKIIPQY